MAIEPDGKNQNLQHRERNHQLGVLNRMVEQRRLEPVKRSPVGAAGRAVEQGSYHHVPVKNEVAQGEELEVEPALLRPKVQEEKEVKQEVGGEERRVAHAAGDSFPAGGRQQEWNLQPLGEPEQAHQRAGENRKGEERVPRLVAFECVVQDKKVEHEVQLVKQAAHPFVVAPEAAIKADA